MPRQDTRLESEGAEFLVLSQLLIAGIPTFKSYTNNKLEAFQKAEPTFGDLRPPQRKSANPCQTGDVLEMVVRHGGIRRVQALRVGQVGQSRQAIPGLPAALEPDRGECFDA